MKMTALEERERNSLLRSLFVLLLFVAISVAFFFVFDFQIIKWTVITDKNQTLSLTIRAGIFAFIFGLLTLKRLYYIVKNNYFYTLFKR